MKVLITGASSGMGYEMAKILSSKYDEMVIVGRNKQALQNLKKEILSQNKIKVKISVKDLTSEDEVISLYKNNKDVDFLINNAGFGDYGEFYETSLDKDVDMIKTNVIALHMLTKLYLKDMVEKDSGRILNVASIAGFMPGPLMTTYYATKNYVVKLSEGIREELRKQKSNVKISILCPGPVATNFENAANINFNFNGISKEYVARYCLNHLDRFYIVPKFYVKCSKVLIRLIPSSSVAKIIYSIQAKRNKR